jgi:potassium-transporting ATPase KdpC subunit
MWQSLRTATLLFLLLTIVTGVIYPLAVTAVAPAAFGRQAGGSLILQDGRAVGSDLLGQPFDAPGDFWGRPSATGPVAYNGLGSSGSNQAPTNPALETAVKERIDRLKAADPDNTAAIPADLVTTSASGLDPHISPAAAEYQVQRVARARGLEAVEVRRLVAAHTEAPTFGILGMPRVHVLRLNLALRELQPASEVR